MAVLGFKNLSNRPEEAWVSTALSDWLTTELSAGGQLRTVPAESVARMKIEFSPLDVDSLDRATLARIGRNLATNLVVVGSYASLDKNAGGQFRLDLRLQDTHSGETIEAVSVVGTENHLFDLVSTAGEQLRTKLGVEALTRNQAAQIAVALPANHDAARLYSEGLEKLRVFNALVARDLLQQAIAIEPTYALSHSALASAWTTLGYDEMARHEAKQAFELSSKLSRADRLAVEAHYHEIAKQWEKAVEIYRALFEFFPDSLDDGLNLASAQFNAGRAQEALETLQALRKLPSPLSDDPRIDLIEGQAAESLGDFKQDLAANSRAAEKAAASGAYLLLAQARVEEAWAFIHLGSLDAAARATEEAKRIYANSGDKRGVAAATCVAGIVLQIQGKPLAAKEAYEQALAIFRQMGNKLGIADVLDDLGDVSFALGDLQGARRQYETSMATYQEIGHENGICLTKGALAGVLLGLGDHNGATRASEESVEICRRLGDRSKTAIALTALARALRLEGRGREAKSKAFQAVSLFETIGDKQAAQRARLTVVEILIDEGKWREAEAIAHNSAQAFESARSSPDAALATALWSRALVKSGKMTEARQAIQRATAELAKFHDRETELIVGIEDARIRAASGEAGAEREAERYLETIEAEAGRMGFMPYVLEPELALAEIQSRAGDLRSSRRRLETLAKKAADRGFGLIASEATGDLKAIEPKPE